MAEQHIDTVAGPSARSARTLRSTLRTLRRDRTAAGASAGLVLALVAAVIGFAASATTVAPHISAVGAWLSNDTDGSVTHVNGVTKQADATVGGLAPGGHKLVVSQDGTTVLITDPVTGQVVRVDPDQLKVTQSAQYGAVHSRILMRGSTAYVVDSDNAVVRRIDPLTLAQVGTPVRLSGTFGAAAIDASSTLWVCDTSTGSVTPITGDTAGTPITAGQPGDRISITIARDGPVLTDSTSNTMTLISGVTATASVNLPAGGSGDLLTPTSTEGTVVPAVAARAGLLVLVDTSTSVPTTVTLDGLAGDDLGTPQTLGGRVYVPDNTTGSLIVYDAATGQRAPTIPVTTGHPSALDVFVKDGMLWVNDASGQAAVTVDASGVASHIDKYKPTHERGSASPALSATTGTNTSGAGGPTRGPRPATTTAGAPGRPTVSPAPADPQPATSVRETAQAGSILVQFTPPANGAAYYTIGNLPPGATATPSQVPAGGPYKITVTGLVCSAQNLYAFTVVASYSTGTVTSATGGGTRPCVAPGQVTGLRLDTGTQHRLGIAWNAPSSTGGGPVQYAISGDITASGLATTSFTKSGLTNFQTYSVSVVASNPGGKAAPVNGSKQLSAGPWSGTIGNNALYPVSLRSDASTSSSTVYSFPKGGGDSVRVICVKTGGSWVDPTGSPSGNTWYHVDSSHGSGYVATAYVNTSSSVWSCT